MNTSTIILLAFVLILGVICVLAWQQIIKLNGKNSILEEKLRIADQQALKNEIAARKQLELTAKSYLEKISILEHSHREQMSQANEHFRIKEDQSKKLYEEQQRLSEERFKTLANEVLHNHAITLRQQNESKLTEILTPLRENIEQFKKSITDCYSAEARERFSLEEKIKELISTNQSIGQEAKELSSALRGNSKTQGDWGELVLETILEKSGLTKGIEFTVQDCKIMDNVSARNENGHTLRPDVVIHYPDGKAMIIDSKVSLKSFVAYVNSESIEEKERYGHEHLASIRRHIDELNDKRYQDFLVKNRTDFVMMFIPNEAAYMAAMQLDNSLWQKAYDKRVIIVSPTHLVSALRLIAQLWRHDRQTQNAIEIAEMSGKMYDKFVSFIDDMSKIDKALSSANSAYSSAMNKLCNGTGNLVSRAEKLREMGVKASKRLSDQESQ